MPKNRRRSLYWTFYALGCFFLALALHLALFSEEARGLLVPQAYFDMPAAVKPDSEIKIYFNQPVKVKGVEESFKITPSVAGDILWEEDRRGFTFVPHEEMLPGRKYVLAFSGSGHYWIPFNVEKEIKIDKAPEVEKVSPFEGQGVPSDAKIFVKFDKPTEGYYLDFKVEPEIAFKVESDEEQREFVLIPEKNLEPEQVYEVEVYQDYLGKREKEEVEEKGELEVKKIKDFSFATLSPLELITSYPQNGKRDILLKQKVVLGFNKPIDLESFRDALKVSPQALYQLKPSTNQKTVALYPEGWNQDTDYKITVGRGFRARDGSYLEEDQVVYFKTGNAGGIIKDERRATSDPLIKDGKYIDVNLGGQLLGIYSDGVHLGTYRISSGKSGMRTPTGQFRVLHKERRHWSRKYKLWMPFSMQFTGAGHFIHELPEWPSGYKEGANHLGIPVSHGCIRLGIGPAETVYNFSEIGTVVYAHY